MAKASLKSSELNNKTKHNIPPEKHHHYSFVLMIWLSYCTGKLYKCRMYPGTKRCCPFPKGQVKLLRNFWSVYMYICTDQYLLTLKLKIAKLILVCPDLIIAIWISLIYSTPSQPASLEISKLSRA